MAEAALALARRPDGRPTSLTRSTFRACELCNGSFTAQTLAMPGVGRDRLEALDGIGALEYLDEPGRLEPGQ